MRPPESPPARRGLLARLLLVALPAYWGLLATLTHLPKLHLGGPRGSDKVAHFSSYALLTLLFWGFVQALGGPLRRDFAWKAFAILLAYGLLDEYTQQFVGRSADVNDLMFDALGIASVLALLEWRRRAAARPPA